MLPFEDLDPRDGTSPTTTTTGGGGTGGSSTTSSGGSNPGGGGSNTGGTGNTGGATGGSGGSGGAGGAPILHAQYTADIAECIDPAAPDPDACEQEATAGNMEADLQAGAAPYHVNQGFVRFTLDQQVAGHTVLTVTLRLVVTTQVGADSNSSGQSGPSAPSTSPSLSSAAPSTIELVSAARAR